MTNAPRPSSSTPSSNVILIGPTGVGKTYLVKHVAELIGVPFVKADATKFSETGYVGGDVEDLVRDLIAKADGDANLAQYGIIYIDEIDKIAAASQRRRLAAAMSAGAACRRRSSSSWRRPRCPCATPWTSRRSSRARSSSSGAAAAARRARKRSTRATILFIVSGAFERLRDQVARRLRQSQHRFRARRRRRGGADDAGNRCAR